MTDELTARRCSRTRVRPSGRGRPAGTPRPAEPPRWVRTFVVPAGACPPCIAHLHHRCHGVDVLLDPPPDCPCDCGDHRTPLFLNPRAWADLAVHAPDQVWIAALFERQRAAGIHQCTRRPDDSGLQAARPE